MVQRFMTNVPPVHTQIIDPRGMPNRLSRIDPNGAGQVGGELAEEPNLRDSGLLLPLLSKVCMSISIFSEDNHGAGLLACACIATHA